MMVYVKLEAAQEKTLFSPSFSDGKSHKNTMKSSSFVIFALLSHCCGLGRKEKSSDLLQADLAALGVGSGEGPRVTWLGAIDSSAGMFRIQTVQNWWSYILDIYYLPGALEALLILSTMLIYQVFLHWFFS